MSDLPVNSHDEESPVDAIIADILEAQERGEPIDRRSCLEQHPEWKTELESFFNAAEQFHVIAGDVARGCQRGSTSGAASDSDAGADEPTHVFQSGDTGCSDDPQSVPAVGSRFGEYDLLEEIARGGMGVVFKARHRRLNRIVALKMILAGELASRDEIRRFQVEARAAAALDHPGIVPIYEVGEIRGQHYYAMGFVDGISLARRVLLGPLPPVEAATLVQQISEAIQYAHDRGVIHRDLKPGNVLLQGVVLPSAGGHYSVPEGGDVGSGHPLPADGGASVPCPCSARVTDFGLAKQMAGDSQITRSHQILGTPSYMPPEQAAGRNDLVGPAADIYALGAVLYCLLVGRPPFQAASPLETLLQVQREEPATPRRLNSSLPVDLDTIVMKCLEKDPGRRYRSARDVSAELGRFLRGEPIRARRTGRLERAWRWCRRNPLPAGLGFAASLTLIAATILSVMYARSEHHRATNEAAASLKITNQSSQIERDSATIQRQSASLQEEHRAGLKQLARALLSEARARRMSGRPGQRFDALRALRESMKISGPSRELANEAAAALCLPDWEVEFEWDGFPEGTRRLALSPTFDQYARVDGENMISIRSLPEDRELATLPGVGPHNDYAGLRFSDDGDYLLERHANTPRSRAWSLAGGRPQIVADFPCAWMEIIPGPRVVFSEGNDLCVRPIATDGTVRRIPVGRPLASQFWRASPDGTRVVISLSESWCVVDLERGVVHPRIASPDTLAAWPALHPNGQALFWTTNSNPGGVFLDARTGSQLAPRFKGHQTQGVIPILSRHGDVAFSNDWHMVLRMWDPYSGRPLLNRPYSDTNQWQVVSSDNQRIGPEIVGSRARWLRFASGREFRVLATACGEPTPTRSIDFSHISPDGRFVAFWTRDGLLLHDVLSGLPAGILAEGGGETNHVVRFTADGDLITAEGNQLVRRTLGVNVSQQIVVGSPRSYGPEAQLSGGVLVRSGASSDGAIVAVPRPLSKVVVLRRDADVIHVAANLDVRHLSVSPRGNWVATGEHNAVPLAGAAKIWDAKSGTLLQTLESRGLCRPEFSPGGKYLVVFSGEASECRVFETDTWAIVAKLQSKAGGVFSADDSLFALEAGPGEISLRRGPRLEEFARLAAPDENTYRPVFWSPDRSRLFAVNLETRQLAVWNLALLRQGLNEMGLASDWPEISQASSPAIAPPAVQLPNVAPTSDSTGNPSRGRQPSGTKSQSAETHAPRNGTKNSANNRTYSAATQLEVYEKSQEGLEYSRAMIMGVLRIRTQQWQEAIADYRLLIRRPAADFGNWAALLSMLLYTENEAEFRELSPVALERFSNSPMAAARWQIAVTCLLRPEWCPDANQCLQTLESLARAPIPIPIEEQRLLGQAWLLVQRKQEAGAVALLNELLKRELVMPDATIPQSRLLLAQCHHALGDPLAAVAELDQAMRHIVRELPAPGLAELDAAGWPQWLVTQIQLRETQRRILGRTLSYVEMVQRSGERPFVSPNPLRPRGKSASSNEPTPPAEPLTVELRRRLESLNQDPRNPDKWIELANYQGQLANFPGAVQSARQALQLAPGRQDAWTIRVVATLALPKPDASYPSLCQQALAQVDDSASGATALAAARLFVFAPNAVEDYTPVLALVDRAAASEIAAEHQAAIRLVLAGVMLRAQDFEAALELARRVERQPGRDSNEVRCNYVQARFIHGLALRGLGRLDESESILAQARVVHQNLAPRTTDLGVHWVDWMLCAQWKSDADAQ